ALQWRRADQRLVRVEPVPVDIGLLGDRALLDLFGRQILSLRVCVDEALDLASVADTRKLDVQQLDVAILEHHHVARTDGAVDDAHVVQGLDGSAELEGQSQHHVDPERRSAGHQLTESAALDELRDGEGPAHVELAELKDSGHRGMRGRGADDRAAHPQHGLRSLRRVREAAREETDRDSMAGRLVLTDADCPERACADLVDDAIATLHPQPTRDSLTELAVGNRRRTRPSFSCHYWAPLDI